MISQRSHHSRLPLAIALGLILVLVASGGLVAQKAPSHDLRLTPHRLPAPEQPLHAVHNVHGQVAVFVELTGEPTSRAFARKVREAGGARAAVMASANRAAVDRLAAVRQEQKPVAAALAGMGARELYRLQRAANGIAAFVAPSRIAELRAMPGVKSVRILTPEYPLNSTAVPYTGAPGVWDGSAGLPAGYTGEGVVVGIIDSGIDYIHTDFGGPGTQAAYDANDPTTADDGSFPTAKVTGGTDLVGDDYDGSNTPMPDDDPMGCLGHGTHVAGIAAGFGVNADGSTFAGPYGPGIDFGSLTVGPGTAPGADLWAIRVFGCSGSTLLTAEAIEYAMDPDGDGEFDDAVDVINMSLGSPTGSPNFLSAMTAQAAVDVGVVVVVSAGNEGDTYFVTGSPGVAPGVVSVASSYDDGVVAPQLDVNAPPEIAGPYDATAAAFGGPLTTTGVTADLMLVDDANSASPTDGCDPIVNDLTGKIALIDRGSCSFVIKVKNAQVAGAVGAVVANNAGDGLITMIGDDPTITIPSIFIGQSDGATLKTGLGGGTVNVTMSRAVQDQKADTLSGFSSRGPSVGAPDIGLKPDITAPGSSITSAGVFSGNGPAVLSGTSMASPHVAGIAALLKEIHPGWGPLQVKAALMNTADHYVFFGDNQTPPRYGNGREGSGRVDAPQAATAEVVAYAQGSDRVSVAFGGEVVTSDSWTANVTVSNLGTTSRSYDLSFDTVVDAPGIDFSFDGPASITVPGGGEVMVPVRVTADPTMMAHTADPTASPTQDGGVGFGPLPRATLTEETANLLFTDTDSGPDLRVTVYSTLEPASHLDGTDVLATGGNATGSGAITMTGTGLETMTGAGIPVDVVSLVTALELQHVSPRDPSLVGSGFDSADIHFAGVGYDPATDLLAFGISSYNDFSTLNEPSFAVFIDTDLDGVDDLVIWNNSTGTLASSLLGVSSADTDDHISWVIDFNTGDLFGLYSVNLFDQTQVDTDMLTNNVTVLWAPAGFLGIDGKFRWRVESCPAFLPVCSVFFGFDFDQTGMKPFDIQHPGLDFATPGLAASISAPPGAPVYVDEAGGALAVDWNLANLEANRSYGALLIHHHNMKGHRAEVVKVEGLGAQGGQAFTCVPDAHTACLQGGKFEVTVEWEDFQGHTGQGTIITQSNGDSTLWQFFGPTNMELIVKVLDACSYFGHYWVLAGGATNVGVTITVREAATGKVVAHTNTLGDNFTAFANTAAFLCGN